MNFYNALEISERQDGKRTLFQLLQTLNAKTVFVKSNKTITADNLADKAVAENYEYDYVVQNTGSLDDLRNKTIDFIKDVIK